MSGPSSPAMEQLQTLFNAQRDSFSYDTVPSVPVRKMQLDALKKVIRARQNEILEATRQDFGARSPFEALASDVALPIQTIGYLTHRLPRLARRRETTQLLSTIPGRTFVTARPKGVVGIMGPWNYPFQLVAIPAITAIAAGNKVLIKPSELTPHTNRVLIEIFGEVFGDDDVAFVEGGPMLSEGFTKLPFDHLFFTGSTAVGRKVAKAAAENLTPVTLELGGKSPCVVLTDVDLDQAVEMIAFGKMFNGGQSCVSVDHVYVPSDRIETFAQKLLARLGRSLPEGPESENVTRIINEQHFNRLTALIADAEQRGAEIERLWPFQSSSLAMPPTLVLDPSPMSDLMREEIFGPVLPVIPYDDIEEPIEAINKAERPLAMYVFGNDMKEARNILDRTISGGAMINGTKTYFAVEHLPFGGIGASGYGAYHGDAGFYEFSHQQSVMEWPRWKWLSKITTPPYGGVIKALTRWTIRR